MSNCFKSFQDFYPHYLSEHRNPTCRRLHCVGSTLVLVFAAAALLTWSAWWLAAAVFAGYGLAWIGHFFFEHNRPATFRHPIYSLIGDWVMFKDVLTGRIRF
ncbi:MAG: Mpo1-like protein [Casimicrobiaceae bacterium]